MKARQLDKIHSTSLQGRFAVKSPAKRMKIKWRFVQFNPDIHH